MLSKAQSEWTVLNAGRWPLVRATGVDLDAVVALQHAAYARNRILLGVEPLPLQADYQRIFEQMEIWLARDAGALIGCLILELRPDDLMIWSIATAPTSQAKGLGGALLAAAEFRSGQLGHTVIRLYTGTKLDHLVNWYTRHGYATERLEILTDRSVTHMVKCLDDGRS